MLPYVYKIPSSKLKKGVTYHLPPEINHGKLLLPIRMSLDLSFPVTSFYFLFPFGYFPSSMEQKIAKSGKKIGFSYKNFAWKPIPIESNISSNCLGSQYFRDSWIQVGGQPRRKRWVKISKLLFCLQQVIILNNSNGKSQDYLSGWEFIMLVGGSDK